MNEFPFGCSSLFTGEMIPCYSRMSSNQLTLSCKRIGILLAHWFLKFASGFRGNCSGEFNFPISKLDVAYTIGYFSNSLASCSNSFGVI